ncbi:MAG: hypothetical protein MUE83_00270 [Tabrizicola sp.]|jgi:hypothetical protein|nr:hypothetical protein [Tabrizicola sp.]
MTRCSDLGPILAALILAPPALAEPLVSDAFGLYDPATSAAERQDWAGLTTGGAAKVIAPGEPDELLIFAGPKSSVAGKDPSHVVAIVVDRFGNLVADGTPAVVSVDGTPTATQVTGGIADLLLPPRTKAEDLFVGVTAGPRQSPQAMLSIVADIASIRPEVVVAASTVAADTAFDVRSAPLTDRFGNPVPQGTGAAVLIQHADGSYSLASGLAIQDTALTRFIARDIPGPADVAMTLGAQTSAARAMSIEPPISAGAPALDLIPLPEIAAVRLMLGPFLTTDGYALPDGAQVTVAATLPDGTEISDAAWVQDGEISLMLPIANPASVTQLSLTSPLGPMDLTADWQTAATKAAALTEPAP